METGLLTERRTIYFGCHFSLVSFCQSEFDCYVDYISQIYNGRRPKRFSVVKIQFSTFCNRNCYSRSLLREMVS